MVWALAAVFFVITVVFLSGRGAFLIAGYNLSSKEAKLKYVEKKLCRVMGGGMGIITVFLFVFGCFEDFPPDWFLYLMIAGTIASVVIVVILCNTICRAKNPVAAENTAAETTEAAAAEKKRTVKIVSATYLLTAVVLVIMGIMMVTGDIKITLVNGKMEIASSYWKDYQVELNHIQSVTYTESLNAGSRTNGLGSFQLLAGSFRNNEFGDYSLYAYVKCESYVVLDTAEGIVVVNAETPEKTRDLYEDLERRVKQIK